MHHNIVFRYSPTQLCIMYIYQYLMPSIFKSTSIDLISEVTLMSYMKSGKTADLFASNTSKGIE
jgi:hypothetical protein